MSTTSRVFAVLRGLYSAYDAAFPDVTLFRSKPTRAPDKTDYLSVGWAPGVSEAVTFRQDYQGGTLHAPRLDDFTITNFLRAATGSNEDQAVLDAESRLEGYWDQIQNMHRSDPTLNGALGLGSGSAGFVQVTGGAFIPAEATVGFVAGLVFYVSVESHI